jgi:predicted ATP-grasp superfamily ATP-dependent carboligase
MNIKNLTPVTQYIAGSITEPGHSICSDTYRELAEELQERNTTYLVRLKAVAAAAREFTQSPYFIVTNDKGEKYLDALVEALESALNEGEETRNVSC